MQTIGERKLDVKRYYINLYSRLTYVLRSYFSGFPGFGVMLAKKLVDEVVYNEKGNDVLLVKYVDLPRESQSS